MQLDFTVIVPTKDRPVLLARALASVLAQQGRRFEVIVMDDGDGSGRAAAEMLAAPEVVARSSGGAGQVGSRNLAVALSTGRWITFLDDDDWWEGPGHLDALAQALEPAQALAFGSGHMVFAESGERLAYQAQANWQSIRADNTVLVSSMAYPAEFHSQYGQFDAGLPYYWDWDWYLRLAAAQVPFAAATSDDTCIWCHTGSVSSAEYEAQRQANLDRLRAKHGLGQLALKNHLSLARERAAPAPAISIAPSRAK